MGKFVLLLPKAIKNGTNLYRLFKSDTTKEQYIHFAPFVFFIAVVLSLLALTLPDTVLSDNAILLNILNVIVFVLLPIVSRITAFTKDPVKMLDIDLDTFVCKVKKAGDVEWNIFKGTIMDAYEEGYEEAVIWKPNTHYLKVFSIKENKELLGLHQLTEQERVDITETFIG